MRTPILVIFLYGFCIIYDVEAYPAKHEPADKKVYGIEHCVHMTPENEEKISAIVLKLSEYLYNLTIEHEVFDIRLLKIVIEGHSDDEVEEKDTQVQLVVNDCNDSNEHGAEEPKDVIDKEESTIVIDFVEDEQSVVDDNNDVSATATDNDVTKDISNDSQTLDTENGDSENDSLTNSSEESTETNDQTTSTNPNQTERYVTDNVESRKSGIDIDDIQPSSAANSEVQGPVLVRLDLDKNGNELIRRNQAKRGKPLIFNIQGVLTNIEYLFAN